MHEHSNSDPLPHPQERVKGGKLLESRADCQQLTLQALGVLLHVQGLREGGRKEGGKGQQEGGREGQR